MYFNKSFSTLTHFKKRIRLLVCRILYRKVTDFEGDVHSDSKRLDAQIEEKFML